MSTRKRGTSPNEASNQANKRPRVQNEIQIDSPAPPNLQRTNIVDSGRPGSLSNRVPQAGPHQTPTVQIPREQIDQGVKARPKLILRPPRLPDPPGPCQAGPTDPGSSHSETSTCYSQAVCKYDVEPSVDALGEVEDEDLKKWEPDAAEFIRSTSGLEENWVGIRPLGKGGNGIAGLWELRDDNGQTMKVRLRTR